MAEHENWDPKHRKALEQQPEHASLSRRLAGEKLPKPQTEVSRAGAPAPEKVIRVQDQMTYAPGPRAKILSQGYGAVPVSSEELYGPPVDLKKNSGTGKRFRDRK